MIRDLIEAFWPGGLTLVVEHAPSLAWDLGDARGTVAIRMPLHPVALELLDKTGPMAVSSANVSGDAAGRHRAAGLRAARRAVSVYLDGGEVPIGQPSTIVDMTSYPPVVLPRGRGQPGRLAAGRREPSSRPVRLT